MKASAVATPRSELNYLEVIDVMIKQGMVILMSSVTKCLSDSFFIMPALLAANPAAIVKKIDKILDSIVAMRLL